MTESPPITLHFAPRTRSLTALWGLEELGVPYALHRHDLAAGTHRTEAQLGLNPMGKLPTVVDGGVACAETGAILLWLADRYAAGRLAPTAHAPERADFLRWLFFSGSVMEPALGEVFFKWKVPSSSVAWGSFARMERALSAAVDGSTWLLGDTFTVADVAVGGTARFGVRFGAIAADGPIGRYVARCEARPALQRALAIEAEAAGA